MLMRVLTCAAFAVAFTGASLAGPLENGVAAYDEGNYSSAMQLWLPLAEQGDVVAQFNVGIMYDKGHGVPQDAVEAARWYQRAAERGDVISQFKLGLMYAEGDGIAQDYDLAARWYLLAAENNHVRAQFSVGTMYANGQGLAQNLTKATEWYERADNTSCSFGDIAAANAPRLQ